MDICLALSFFFSIFVMLVVITETGGDKVLSGRVYSDLFYIFIYRNGTHYPLLLERVPYIRYYI
jgi:hypothetical protein